MEPTDDRRARRAAAVSAMRQQQARRQRRGRFVLAGGVVVAALLVVVAVVVTGLGHQSTPARRTTATTGVIGAVTSISTAAFDTVGDGDISNPPQAISGPPLTQDGRPRVVYVGAEFCPFCAAERWGLVAALARFGTFANLGQTRSAASDGNLATLTFHGSTYTSRYLSFTPYEVEDGARQPLEAEPADVQQLETDFGAQGIPFLDIAGAYASDGASDTDVPQLISGLSHAQIAAAMRDPSTAVGQKIDGIANVLTYDICQVTHGQPGAVCSSEGVTAARPG